MNNATHTPGPWEAVYMELLERKRTLANIEELTEVQRAGLAQVNTELDRHYALREAAPAMYEALKAAFTALSESHDWQDRSEVDDDLSVQIREALAQADRQR